MAEKPNQGVSGFEARSGQAGGSPRFDSGAARVAAQNMLSGQVAPAAVQGGRITDQGVVRGNEVAAAPPIPKFLQDKLAGEIQANEGKAFWRGLTEARQGKAIGEIEKNRPWYTGIFGPDGFVEGARYYTAQKAISDWELQNLKDMNELRKVDGSEIGPMLNESAARFMTGSPETDAQIQAAMIKRAGPLIDQHAKARYAWLNEQAYRAQSEAFASASQAYQVARQNFSALSADQQNDPTNRQVLQESARNAMQALALPEGQTDESAEKFIGSAALGAAQRGDFHTVNLMRDSGMLGLLSPEKAKTLEDQIERYENRTRRKAMATDLSIPLALLGAKAATGNLSPLEIANESARINGMASESLGLTQPIINPDDLTRMATSSASQLLRADERRADRLYNEGLKAKTEEEKARQKAELQSNIVQGIIMGNGGAWQAMPGVPAEEVQGIASQMERQMSDDQWRSTAVQNFNQTRFVARQVADRYQAQVASTLGEDWSQAFEDQYENWTLFKNSKGGEAAAAAYFGDYHFQFLNFESLQQGGVPKEVAFRKAFGNENLWGTMRVDPEDRKEAAKQIDKALDKTDAWYWSENQLNESSKAVVSQAMQNSFVLLRKNSPSMSVEQAAQQSYQLAKANGLEHYGAWAWQNPKGTLPFFQMAGLQEVDAAGYLNDAINEAAEKVGVPITYWKGNVKHDQPFNIHRYADEGGLARIRVDFYVDHEPKTIFITSDDLRKLRDKGAAKTRRQVEYRNPLEDRTFDLW